MRSQGGLKEVNADEQKANKKVRERLGVEGPLVQRELSAKLTEGLICKDFVILQSLRHFFCKNATSLYTREALAEPVYGKQVTYCIKSLLLWEKVAYENLFEYDG